MHKPAATGTVSKYFILRDLTSTYWSSDAACLYVSCSIVTLYKSPSSLWRRKKNAPWKREIKSTQQFKQQFEKLTLILCITAATIIIPRSVSANGCLRRGMGTRCCGASMSLQIIWSSQHIRTPEGPSNSLDDPDLPPGTKGKIMMSNLFSMNFKAYLAQGGSLLGLSVHSIFWQRDWDPNPVHKMSTSRMDAVECCIA